MNLCSVVVAAYNIQSYLPRCLDSLLSQTASEIEIIVVDDGSTDKTRDVADKYAAKDPRVRVVRRPNGGLSAARNTGFAEANGRYVIFIDGDDWVDPRLVEVLTGTAQRADAEVVIAGCHVDVHDQAGRTIRTSVQVPPPLTLGAGSALDREDLGPTLVNLIGYAWNKLYSVEFLREEHLDFVEGLSLVEDVVFNAEALPRARRVVAIPEAFVHYVQAPRATLGNASYPDFLELRGRAIDAVRRILVAWQVPPTEVERVSSRMAVAAVVKAVRLEAQAPRRSGYALSDELEQSADVLLLASRASNLRARDRLMVELMVRRQTRAAVGLARLWRSLELRRRSGTSGL